MNDPQYISQSKPVLDDLALANLTETYQSNMISAGKIANKFKSGISNYLEYAEVELFSSGTSALYWGLKALNLNEGMEVLIPNYICIEVSRTIYSNGLIPVYYDNSEASWISDKAEIKKKISKKTGAVIVNYTFGIALEFIAELKNELNISIIEDRCHAFCKNIGDFTFDKTTLFSFFSFHATKLITTGEGGAICTNDLNFLKELRKIKCDIGINDLSASIGIAQIKRMDEFLEKRRAIANYFFFEIPDLSSKIKGFNSIYFRFPIWFDNSNLHSERVIFRKGVDELNNYNIKELPNSFLAFNNTINLPIYPDLTNHEQRIIVDEIKKICKP